MYKILKKFKPKIFILSIAKLDNSSFKLTYLPNFELINENYKGYFIDELIIRNDFLFKNFNEKDFYKWYGVELDYVGDLLCLYYKNRKINI